jgi:hypothetical protein
VTPVEVERLARMASSIRPDWPVTSLKTALTNFTDTHPERSYPDTAHALLAIALDPQSINPGRLTQNGPWWKANPVNDPRDKPAYYGPTAELCRKPIALEDGTPSRCNRLVEPDGSHQCRNPQSEAKAKALAGMRQQLADTQGGHARAEAEAQRVREETER